jgi:bile acid-coenzyme A ligase
MTGSATRQSFSRVISARAERRPDEVVVISEHEGITLTGAELDARSNALAREYLARGVRRDDLVAVALPNSAEFVIACAAVWKAGATPHPIDPALPPDERAVLEELGHPTLALGARPVDPSIPCLPQGFTPHADESPLPDAWARSWKAPMSSGSTGLPKIVAATAPALIDPDQRVAPFLPRTAVQLVLGPLWHSASFTYAFRGLLTGHRLILTERFDEKRFGELVARHRVTWTLLSPSMIHRLVAADIKDEVADVASLESVLHMGAPCAPADKRALIARLGAEKVVEVYAGSESNGLTMITGDEWLRKPGSVGKPLGDTKIRIQRSDGSPSECGEIGQVWMRRGEHPAYRYLGARSRRTDEGWDTLGDLGFLDDDGYLTVIDRAADVIEHRGTTVYPARVEQLLESHPGVRGAVVYADDTDDGIPLIAAVVDIGDAGLDATDIQRYARTRLSAGERPARIDITRTPLRNQAGKVRRSTFRNPHHRRYTAKV